MQVTAAIIGGTGIGSRLNAMGGEPCCVPTPFGPMRCRIIEHAGKRFAAVSRHAAGHTTPPHLVNYRALAVGVRALGAKACLSSAAVGGLHEDWPVGTLAVCSDFLDVTARNLTLFDQTVVHTDFSRPFDKNLRAALISEAGKRNVAFKENAVYVNGNGPRYETPAEITLYREWGGDVVGMTAATEAIAMGEAGVPYACVAVVTNFACGILDVALSHGEVADEMERTAPHLVEILLAAAATVD